MVANPWQDKKKLCSALFDPDQFEKDIDLVYLDIPQLHEFSEEGELFFALLAKTKQMDLFAKTSV
jgi:hypothetical protein